MKPQLGKLTRITDLRSVWKDEAKDFTPWLAKEENIAILSEAIGIDITVEEQESSVGKFSLDIFAKETGGERRIIIENQLEETNHDHLGKTITYAAGKDAQVIVWIVKNARQEHTKAIEWLNNHTDDDVAFFLIEIQLWSVNGSEPAPYFNIVEQPNDWARLLKRQTSEMTSTQVLRLEYWSALRDYAFSKDWFRKEFSPRKPSTDHWYSLATGIGGTVISFLLQSSRNELDVEFNIVDNKEMYRRFAEHKKEINDMVSHNLVWHELPKKKSSKIIITQNKVNFNNRDDWESQFEWLMEYAVKMKKAFTKFQ